MKHYVLDINGEPVEADLYTFAMWFESGDRVLKQDKVGDVLVSTVFLGIDHNFSGRGPPVLWETMIFGGRYTESQGRWSSKEEALNGHALALAAVKDEAATIDAEVVEVKPKKALPP